jgi:hypothetical protein
MKAVSIVLTVLLGVVAGVYFSTFKMWYDLIENNQRKRAMFYGLERTSLIAAICFSFVFVLSLILTVKGKYKSNCFLFGFCILTFIIISMIIHA